MPSEQWKLNHKRFVLWMTGAELARARQAAAQQGISVSQLLRSAIPKPAK